MAKLKEKEIDNLLKVKDILDADSLSYVTYKFNDDKYAIFCYSEKRKISKVEITQEKALLILADEDTQILVDLLDPQLKLSAKENSILLSTKNTSVFLF